MALNGCSKQSRLPMKGLISTFCSSKFTNILTFQNLEQKLTESAPANRCHGLQSAVLDVGLPIFLARFTGKLESLSADDVTAAAGRPSLP